MVYSNIENLVLWARSELHGSALEFCVSEYWPALARRDVDMQLFLLLMNVYLFITTS